MLWDFFFFPSPLQKVSQSGSFHGFNRWTFQDGIESFSVGVVTISLQKSRERKIVTIFFLSVCLSKENHVQHYIRKNYLNGGH